MGDIQVSRIIPSELTIPIWERAAEQLERAVELSNGRCTIDALLIEVLHDRQQLWIGYVGDDDLIFSLTTAITDYPSRRLLAVPFISGEHVLENLDTLYTILRRFGEENKCDGMEAYGRKGWERALAPWGFDDISICLMEDW